MIPSPSKHRNCWVSECHYPAYIRGMCQRHYRTWKKWGNPKFQCKNFIRVRVETTAKA